MLSLAILPKILYKPREAFEELKDNTTASEGILMLILVSVFSLLIFGAATSALGINLMVLDFGFGTLLEFSSAALFFGLQFFGILIIAMLVNLIAGKFGGSGNFHETFAFVCYSKVLNIIPMFVSIFALIWLRAKIFGAASVLNEGALGSIDFIGTIFNFTVYGSAILAFWGLYILTEAVSVSHGISRLKSFIAVLPGFLIILFLTSYVSQFIA